VLADGLLAGALRRARAAIHLADAFVRLNLLFYTSMWFLLGAAAAARRPTTLEVLYLFGVSCCFHVFAYVLNDVIDLPIDRGEPARRHDPLVRGAISQQAALLVVLVQPLLATILAEALSGHAVAYWALAAAFALLGAYNLWGKRCVFPPLTDMVQGMGWGSCAIYAALALDGTPTALSWIVAAYAMVYTMFINGLHGGLRDLANDLASGARTTAIVLGARPSQALGQRLVPPVLAAYAWAILAALITINVVTLQRNDFGYGPVTMTLIALFVGGLNVWAVALHPRMLRPRGGADQFAWRLQMYLMLTALPVAFAAHADASVLIALLLLNALGLALWDNTSAVITWVRGAVGDRRVAVPTRGRP
jgi:4-hydroxybenzoate polyprenyltransferase